MESIPEFLTVRKISAHVESIISDSKEFVFLVSAYLYVPEGLITEINAAIRRKVRIVIVFGKVSDLNEEQMKRLNSINGEFEIYFHKRLHAKAYLNETNSVITSLNLQDYSEINNIEYGVSANSSTLIYKNLKEKVENLISESEPVSVTKDKIVFRALKKIARIQQSVKGWCIRCWTDIDYNRAVPLCPKCYRTWAKYGDVNFPEEVCHQCGKKSKGISKNHPVCNSCY